MKWMRSRSVRKLVVLAALLLGLSGAGLLEPREALAACAPSVYEYCWSIGRNVNPFTCQCQGCLGLPASDCTEMGCTLNMASCTCVCPPEYW